jgi:hypothetical protein
MLVAQEKILLEKGKILPQIKLSSSFKENEKLNIYSLLTLHEHYMNITALHGRYMGITKMESC